MPPSVIGGEREGERGKGRGRERGREFLLVVPEEVILVLADLNRAPTILHHHISTKKKKKKHGTINSRDPSLSLTCGIKTRSPGFTEISILLPSLSNPPGPTARTLASDSFSTVDSGRKIPEAVFASALMRWTRMRSRRGARDLMERREVACSGGVSM